MLRLSEDSRADLGLAEAVRRGLPIATVDAVIDAGLVKPEEVDRLVVPRDELARRRERNQALAAPESDRVVSIARMLILAAENFGELQKGGDGYALRTTPWPEPSRWNRWTRGRGAGWSRSRFCAGHMGFARDCASLTPGLPHPWRRA